MPFKSSSILEFYAAIVLTSTNKVLDYAACKAFEAKQFVQMLSLKDPGE
jgi:hypothetical protein